MTEGASVRTDERTDAVEQVRAKRLANLKPWKPGVSGNPRGDSRAGAGARTLARQYGPEAIARLVSLMRGKNRRLALDAAKEILARAYGKPVQPASFVDEEGHDRPLPAIHPDAMSDLDAARRIAWLLTQGLRARETLQSAEPAQLEERPTRANREPDMPESTDSPADSTR